MNKPMLTIDDKACWGCKTCEVACKQEMKSPDGVKLISVLEEWTPRSDGTLDFQFRVRLCRHCDEPPCAEAHGSRNTFSMSRGNQGLQGRRSLNRFARRRSTPRPRSRIPSWRGSGKR